jgi:hypothetical protein
MNMAVANDTLSRKGDVPATNVANDDGANVVSRVSREPVGIIAYPIVIFDACFYTGSLLQLVGGRALMVVEVLRHDQTLPRKPRSRTARRLC